VTHESGGYWDYCDFPLEHATEAEVAAWPMPDPDLFDYSGVAAQCRQWQEFACFTGGAGFGDFINANGFLRTMEQTLVDLIEGNPAGLLLAERRVSIYLEHFRRIVEASEGGIDFIWMGEDLGTQRGPTISLATYRQYIRPLHQRIVDMAKSFDLPVMIHSCGSSSWAYNDFIEMGIDVVDTLQPEAKNMAPAYLKQTYGDRLAFHGCISTAGPVAYGTIAEVEADCRAILKVMMPGGGYSFAPTHSLQDNSPTANVVAMYDLAKREGRYA
jgi:uroporphyrinogen decarboxylase